MNRKVIVAVLITMLLAGCSKNQDDNSAAEERHVANHENNVEIYEEPDVNTILADLKHDDWTRRRDAAISITTENPIKIEYRPAIPDLIVALGSEHDSLTLAAATALSGLADRQYDDNLRLAELSEAIQPLSTIISGGAPEETRRWAVIAIVDIAMNLGPDAIKSVLPILTEAATDESNDVSQFAMDGLGEFGNLAADSIPTVIQQLSNGDRRAAIAAEALAKIGCKPKRCVPELIATLRIAEKGFVTEQVVEALARFGTHSGDAVPLLIPLLDDDSDFLKRKVAFALGQIGSASEPAIPSLAKAFANSRQESIGYDVKIATLAALVAIGEKGEKRVSQIVDDLTEFKIHGDGWLLTEPNELLRVLSKSKTITRLVLQDSNLEDDDLIYLASMPKLQELILPDRTSDDGLQHISGLSNLRVISQSRTSPESHNSKPITDAGLKSLVRLKSLKTLSLWSADISNDGMVELKNFPLLETLSLGGNSVTDEGMVHLSGLSNLKKLQLGATNVGDRGVAILVKEHPGLEVLDLCNTKITDKCVLDLSKLSKLRWLGVYATPLNGPYPSKSDATVKLERLLPNCKIIWLD